ncbi:MAG: glycoside hydrolase domain-containing protein [Thermoleophilaceae bacterium]
MKAAALVLAALVNPFAGTAGNGNTFPGATVPFGMVQNSPDTSPGTIREFSLVHVSGAGVPLGGQVRFMPGAGPAGFSHANEAAEPGYYRVKLDSGVTVELTAGLRTAVQRYTFPPGAPRSLTVGGQVRRTGRAELSGSDGGVFFVARFSGKIGSFSGGRATFDAPVVTARIGISWVDVRGARRNLERGSFDAVLARARAAWNRELGTVRVTGGGDQRTFYTALYHALLQPNVFSDADGRYRGLDHRVHRARGRVQYTELALWDSEKSTNQLLALLEPRRDRDVLLSLLADYRQRGKLPRWVDRDTDPAYMEGDPALPAIADGVCRGLVSRPDASALYDAGLKLRRRRDRPAARASTAYEYGVDDFALALVADRLGRRRDARRLASASLAYRSPLGGGFLEGTAFQYSWLAPHDARGLFDRLGGDAAAVRRLDEFFASPVPGDNPNAPTGHRYEAPGYAVGNEQDLQVPWMYAFARAPARTSDVLARLRGWFSSAPDGLPGNDDLGALSSWYVFAALGFGPVTPGAPFYVLSQPAFSQAVVLPHGRRPFAIVAGAPARSWLPDSALRRNTVIAGAAPPSAERPPSLSDSPLRSFGCR